MIASQSCYVARNSTLQIVKCVRNHTSGTAKLQNQLFFNCMAFGSCDIVLQQVRCRHARVCCSWILQDWGVGVVHVHAWQYCISATAGLQLFTQVGLSSPQLNSPSCQPEVITAEPGCLSFGLAAPFGLAHVSFPALHQVLGPSKRGLWQPFALAFAFIFFLEQIAVCVKLCGFVMCR